MTVSYNDLYLDVRKALKKEGVEAASLEARELVCAASGKSREEFFRDMPLYAPDFVQTKLDDLLLRRLRGEPVAYLVGEWEFYGLTLTINRHVLIPRPETEILVDRAVPLMACAGEGGRILDLCAGSGAIGLAVVSQVKTCRAVLIELSPEALQVCKQNIRRNHLSGRAACLPGDAKQPPDPSLWDFDVIVCNPPYIPSADIAGLDASVREYEPHGALDGGADGLDFYRVIARLWKDSLRLGGSLIFEVGIHQAAAVRQIMIDAGYEDIQVLPDAQGIDRVVEGRNLKDLAIEESTQENEQSIGG